ncbi:alpha/beta fold hydrolase [Actinomadura sp. J1-007]|uniref:alpha/beta fold hydrolase n=1 Tax=Actinomadura sp. J1-007 TaxID=2661913 RepID=UPI0019D5381B|nr:alpha/beta fold hydrolase [Actinomadura sp. J1-007]
MPDPGGLAARTFRSTGPGGAPAPPSGPPVLLVHGFASDGEGDWVATGLAAALAETGRTVVVPDLPGHGRSPDPATPEEAGAPPRPPPCSRPWTPPPEMAMGAAGSTWSGTRSGRGWPGRSRSARPDASGGPCSAASAPASRSPRWTSRRCTRPYGTGPSPPTR